MKRFLPLLLVPLLCSYASAEKTEGLKKIKVIKDDKAVLKIEKLGIPGLYKVITVGGHCYIVDKSGRYVFTGFIVDTKKPNLKDAPNILCMKEAKATFYTESLSKFPKNAVVIPGSGKAVYLIANLDRKETVSLLNKLLLRKVPIKAVFYSNDRSKIAYILQAKDKTKALANVLNGKYEKVEVKPATEEVIKSWNKYLDKYLLSTKEAFYLLMPAKNTYLASSNKRKIDEEFPFNFTLIKEELIKSAPVIVGSGKGKKIVAVVDPLCPFCKRACHQLRKYAEEGKATFYVYFLPVHGKESQELIAKVLNRPEEERAEVFAEVMEKGLKAGAEPFNPESSREFKQNLKIVKKLGVTGTPNFFFLNSGVEVKGANMRKIIKEIEK